MQSLDDYVTRPRSVLPSVFRFALVPRYTLGEEDSRVILQGRSEMVIYIIIYAKYLKGL